jgi:hypothetical protein
MELYKCNVLPDEAVPKLAGLKSPLSAGAIRSVLVGSWSRWDHYDEELMQRLLDADAAAINACCPTTSTNAAHHPIASANTCHPTISPSVKPVSHSPERVGILPTATSGWTLDASIQLATASTGATNAGTPTGPPPIAHAKFACTPW